MEFTTLVIEIPRLSGEQAAMVQQTLYAFLDAFDTYYAFAVEQYYKDISNPDYYINKVINPTFDDDTAI